MDRFEITASNNDMFSLFHFDKKEGAPKKLTAAVYTCTAESCGQVLLGNHSVGFSCPSCKADMKAGATKDLVASDLADLKTVGDCDFCASQMVSASEATGEFKQGRLYCPVCSDTVAVQASEKDDTEEENPEQADMAPDADSSGEEEMDPNDLPEGDDESGDEGGEGEEGEEGDDTEEDNEDGSEEGDEGGEEEGDGSEDGSEDEPKTDENGNPIKKDKTIDVGSDKDDMDDMTASLLAAVGDKEVDINLVRSPNNKKWFLFADDQPVAVSEKSRCAEGIREHFENDKYAAAYHAATQGDGGVTDEVLKEFGFEPIETKVPVDEAIRQTVEAQVNERARNYTMNAADYNDRMTKCLGLAAMGLVKNTFKDKNPVQDALVASLQRLNVGDAAAIVASAFEKHSPALLKTIMLRASDLMEKEDAAIIEVSKIVDEQPLPSERLVKRGIPPAAMTIIEEERVEKASPTVTPAPLTASMGGDSSGYDNIFSRRRAARG